MHWSHKHFPTAHKIALWYKERDLFEKIGINLVAWAGLLFFAYVIFLAPPVSFPTGAYVKVEEGMSVKAIAARFEDQAVISNAFLFEWTVRALGDDHRIQAGVYYFSRKDNLVWVAMRILGGDFETTAVRITIPEGSTTKDIARMLLEKVPEFNYAQFMARAREGYMFPDTYFFRPGQSTEAILSIFDNNFRVRMLKAQKAITASSRSLEEILIMASILEKEANKTADRQMIAGVLWHRIQIGMPLQTDATFPYYLGRNTFEVTLTDLKTDHPYNTYTNKGLPPGPIGNPGLDSVLAAATPTKNNYIFFLSDRQGNFHYAVTYEQHLANKRKYID